MTNKFKEKQFTAEILSTLYEQVEACERSRKTDYRKVGVTDQQATHWKTGELLWNDEEQTDPIMKEIWDHVEKDEADLSQDDKLYIKVCQQIKAQLEKMI